MTQPGLDPKLPASGSCTILLAQPPWILPGPCLLPGTESCPEQGLWTLRGLDSRPSFTCCKLVLSMFGTSVDLSLFYAAISPIPSPTEAPFHRVGECVFAASLCLSTPAGGEGSPATALQKEGCALGAGTWLWATLSVSVFLPRKIRSVLAPSPGGLEGFPHTVLRSSANEGPGNAECSCARACQREPGQGSQKRVASSSQCKWQRSEPLVPCPWSLPRASENFQDPLSGEGIWKPGQPLPTGGPLPP